MLVYSLHELQIIDDLVYPNRLFSFYSYLMLYEQLMKVYYRSSALAADNVDLFKLTFLF